MSGCGAGAGVDDGFGPDPQTAAEIVADIRSKKMTAVSAVRAALDQGRFVDPAIPPRGSRGKLTRRQREIFQLLANGESTTVAARQTNQGVSPSGACSIR